MLKIRGEMHGKNGMLEFAITGEKVEIKQHEYGVLLRVGSMDLEMDEEAFEVFASELLKVSKISSTSRMSKENSTSKESKIEVGLEIDRDIYNLLKEFCEFTGDEINDWIVDSIIFTMGSELDHMMGYPIKKVEKIARKFVKLTGHPLPHIKER